MMAHHIHEIFSDFMTYFLNTVALQVCTIHFCICNILYYIICDIMCKGT